MPENAGHATCIECGHRFDPISQIELWEEDDRPLTWGERFTIAFVVSIVVLVVTIPFVLWPSCCSASLYRASRAEPPGRRMRAP